jgi:hypothetical protein
MQLDVDVLLDVFKALDRSHLDRLALTCLYYRHVLTQWPNAFPLRNIPCVFAAQEERITGRHYIAEVEQRNSNHKLRCESKEMTNIAKFLCSALPNSAVTSFFTLRIDGITDEFICALRSMNTKVTGTLLLLGSTFHSPAAIGQLLSNFSTVNVIRSVPVANVTNAFFSACSEKHVGEIDATGGYSEISDDAILDFCFRAQHVNHKYGYRKLSIRKSTISTDFLHRFVKLHKRHLGGCQPLIIAVYVNTDQLNLEELEKNWKRTLPNRWEMSPQGIRVSLVLSKMDDSFTIYRAHKSAFSIFTKRHCESCAISNYIGRQLCYKHDIP